ncbi:MAG: peptidoglycan recognition family protein [Kibdelosporangium sp.]
MGSARIMVTVVAAGLALGVVPAAAEPTAPANQSRQHAFTAAASEFGVPAAVLLGVSYLESRWDANAGLPSTSAGYGPMHLTDVVAANPGGSHHDDGTEDPRGDTARAPLNPEPGPPVQPMPQLLTVDTAAALTGVDKATLRSDATQNIRGGAALLAEYQREIGVRSDNPADWYGAVARYGGGQDTNTAAVFANSVFRTIASGMRRVTDDGQQVELAATPVRPDTAQLGRLGLRPAAAADVDCPADLGCEWIPAPYQELPDDDYGNHDKSNRPVNQKVDYIVIHDTEGQWNGVLQMVQDPTYVSWHYTLRSSDGHVAQHVPTKDVAWHAGNWYVNAKAVGLEHEGFAKLGSWYTEAMYQSSAKLVRHLAAKYQVPLDRAHIIGHDNVPGTIPSTVRGMHWDPGPFWDWNHYFNLLGAPFQPSGIGALTGSVLIKPDYAGNKPAFYGCETANQPCTPRGSTSVILRTAPRADAPLLKDVGLHPDGSPGTMEISDYSSRAETGQQFAIADLKRDWTAIWYLGQKGWFHNPLDAPTALRVKGEVVVPKPGRASIPVYGRAYPEASAYPAGITPQDIVPLQYSLPAGQRYTVGGQTTGEYYWATTFDATNHTVVRGTNRYIQIQFAHRIMFVNAADVDVIPSRVPWTAIPSPINP